MFLRCTRRSGRPSIPPEKLLRALLLQVLYTVRSERMLMEQLDYNLLFRWFVGLNMDEAVWDVTVFTKNRERLLKADVARKFFELVVAEAHALNLMSDEHFTVDGTLLEACASLKSFKKVDGGQIRTDDPGNPTVDFHGEKRSNETHASTTDPDALLARKGAGKEAKLSYSGHVLMENRNGLVVDVEVLQANGTAERDAALVMIEAIPGDHRVTVGADKAYDTKDFVAETRNMNATPHVAQNNKLAEAPLTDGRLAFRLRRQPGKAQARGRNLRLDEDRRWNEEVAASRTAIGGLDVHVDCRCLQPGAHAEPGYGSCRRKCMRSSVSNAPQRQQKSPESPQIKVFAHAHSNVGAVIPNMSSV